MYSKNKPSMYDELKMHTRHTMYTKDEQCQ